MQKNIKIINILGINDENRIVVEHNRGSLVRSKFLIEGNGTFLRGLKDESILHTQLFLGGRSCDLNLNLAKNSIIHNSIGIAEGHVKSLGQLMEILDKTKKPIINHPKNILLTARDRLSEVLSGIEGIILPKCIKIIPKKTQDVQKSIMDNNFSYPVLFRPVVMHGAQTLIRLDSETDIDKLQRFSFDGNNAFYLTQFIDYRSEDGFYRKVRILVVGDEVIPRHLILSYSWQIHTEKKEAESEIRQKQRAEEIKFLNSVTIETGKKLQVVKNAIGLDYIGIDCSVDSRGNIIVFEANSFSMIGLGKEEAWHKGVITEAYNALRRLIRAKL